MVGNFKHLYEIDGKIDNFILFHTFQHTIIFLLHPSIDAESFKLNYSLVTKLEDIKGSGYCSYLIQTSLQESLYINNSGLITLTMNK